MEAACNRTMQNVLIPRAGLILFMGPKHAFHSMKPININFCTAPKSSPSREEPLQHIRCSAFCGSSYVSRSCLGSLAEAVPNGAAEFEAGLS